MRNRIHKIRHGRPWINLPQGLEPTNESMSQPQTLRWDDPYFMRRLANRDAPLHRPQTHLLIQFWEDHVSTRISDQDLAVERREVLDLAASRLAERAKDLCNLFFYRTLVLAGREFKEHDDRPGTRWKLFTRSDRMPDLRIFLREKRGHYVSLGPTPLLGFQQYFDEKMPAVFCLKTEDIEQGFKATTHPLGLYWLDHGTPEQVRDTTARETIYSTHLRLVFWLDRRFIRMITEV